MTQPLKCFWENLKLLPIVFSYEKYFLNKTCFNPNMREFCLSPTKIPKFRGGGCVGQQTLEHIPQYRCFVLFCLKPSPKHICILIIKISPLMLQWPSAQDQPSPISVTITLVCAPVNYLQLCAWFYSNDHCEKIKL